MCMLGWCVAPSPWLDIEGQRCCSFALATWSHWVALPCDWLRIGAWAFPDRPLPPDRSTPAPSTDGVGGGGGRGGRVPYTHVPSICRRHPLLQIIFVTVEAHRVEGQCTTLASTDALCICRSEGVWAGPCAPSLLQMFLASVEAMGVDGHSARLLLQFLSASVEAWVGGGALYSLASTDALWICRSIGVGGSWQTLAYTDVPCNCRSKGGGQWYPPPPASTDIPVFCRSTVCPGICRRERCSGGPWGGAWAGPQLLHFAWGWSGSALSFYTLSVDL